MEYNYWGKRLKEIKLKIDEAIIKCAFYEDKRDVNKYFLEKYNFWIQELEHLTSHRDYIIDFKLG
jgi:hypothetical protein